MASGSAIVALIAAEMALRLHDRSRGADDPAAALVASAKAPLAEGREPSLLGLIRPSRWEDIVYELKPGLQGRFRNATLAINSHGFRGREVTVAKPNGTVRVVGLGDSVMFGWGVNQGRDYLSQLEKRLQEEARGGHRVEVLNFAVPGYNTVMEVETFKRKALRFEPDLVILHMMLNDARLPTFMATRRPILSLRYSALWELFQGGEPPGRSHPERYAHMVGDRAMEDALAELARLADEQSIPVLVTTLAEPARPAGMVERVVKTYRFFAADPQPVFSSFLERRGYGWEDFGHVFYLSRRDHHPNQTGHRLYARALAREIRRSGLLPRPSRSGAEDAPSTRPTRAR